MKMIWFLLAAGASLLVLAGCSVTDVFKTAQVVTDVATKLGPLVAPEQMAAFQLAVSQGAPQAEAAFGLLAEVLRAVDAEATARFAEQAAEAQRLTNELATKITMTEAVGIGVGTGLVGGGGGTAWSRHLSNKKHGTKTG